MYLSCPECYTSFVVNSNQIGQNGRRVRCSRCSHAWFATPPKGATSKDFTFNPSDRISNYKEGFKPGVNLPALLPINIPFYLYVIPVILAAAIIFSSMVFFQDKLSFIGLVGASQNLKVHDINISYDKEHGNIVASYKVVNASQEFVPLSNIRIRLLDSHHKVLKSHIADHAHSNLAPRQYVTIRTNFSEAPPNVEYIDITLGSKFDFILR